MDFFTLLAWLGLDLLILIPLLAYKRQKYLEDRKTWLQEFYAVTGFNPNLEVINRFDTMNIAKAETKNKRQKSEKRSKGKRS
jgi:hypothetical protein